MYLKELQIHGFKTFAEKTRIVFTPGVTCVIGPNGSGKSNISDAILWVLGENNVRSLRGSTAQDIIFAGNERRRPLGMAEAALTIDNSAGLLPLDFSEITVTRRLYRSGESEFFINKVACRLKDIYELFLDTGIGRDAYSMVNQGEIDQILSVRAEDRRAIFEEAAGIKKYRVRKREAERKLEHTAQNLLRVNDIIAEIEAQLGPLQRQAAAARRYRDLAAKLRQLEDAWYGTRLRRLQSERGSLKQLVEELQTERGRLDSEMAGAREAEKCARAALQELEQRAEALRLAETLGLQHIARAETERARAEERAGEVRRRLQAIGKELADLDDRIREQLRRSETADREEAGLKRQVDALRAELGAAQRTAQQAAAEHEAAVKDLEARRQAWLARARRQAELEARVQSGEARLQQQGEGARRAREMLEDGQADWERLAKERESFLQGAAEHRSRSEALAKELDALRDAARKAEQELAAARSRADAAGRAHQSHAARLQALSELDHRGEGAAAGAKQLLAAVRRGEVPGQWSTLVEALHVPEGLEKAVEAALGVYADALLCESEEQALAAVDWLTRKKAAALLLPGAPTHPEPLPDSLAARVRAEGPAAAWAALLLGQTVLTGSLSTAAAERARHLDASTPERPNASTPERPNASTPDLWVTATGQWLARSGAASAGPLGAEGAAAAMAHRRELARLQEEAPGLQAAAAAEREAVREAEADLRQAQAAVRAKQTGADAARLEHQSQLREADRRNADVERARHRVERLKQDVARVEQERAAAEKALGAAREELAGAAEGARAGAFPEAGRDTELREVQEQVQAREAERRKAEAAVVELRVRLAQQEQRLQGAVAGARRAAEGGTFLDRQRSERLEEQRTLAAESEQRQLSFGALAQEVAGANGAVEAARSELGALAESRAAHTRESSEARAGVTSLDERQRELIERAHRAEVELTALDAQRSHLGRQWLDAVVSGSSLEASEAGDVEEPLQFTVEGLLAAWDPHAAELTLASHSDPEAEIGRLRRQIRSLGAVNPDAPEQYAAAGERYEFLTSQRADLEAAREKLENAILEIDAAGRETFLKAFRAIAAAFDEMFKKLFGGGSTELRLTDPEDVLETGIDILVQPPGKRRQNLLLLSGGERALTAAAMLFALLTVRPSPFCVLDEVDAPLDEGNVGRFAGALREFSERTQFIVVTHNRGTMESADTLYGVTMEEKGVSKLLSCTLEDPVVARVAAEQRARGPEPTPA